MAEWADRNSLVRRGIDLTQFKVGDKVTFTGLKNRKLAHFMFIKFVVLSDGTVVNDCGPPALQDGNVYGTCAELKAGL